MLELYHYFSFFGTSIERPVISSATSITTSDSLYRVHISIEANMNVKLLSSE